MTEPRDPKNTLESALVRSIDSSSLRDLTTDLAEAAIDQLLDDGPIKDIPILGTLVKARTSIGLVRDYVFTKKVAKFLIGLSKIPEDQRKAFLAKIQARNEDKKFGEVLLVLLDRLDDYERPTLLAKVFRAHVEQDFPLDTFRRLATVVEQLPPGSAAALRAFYSPSREGQETGGEFLSQFAGLGLVAIEFYPSSMAHVGGAYEKTELGKLFMSILDDAT